MTSAMRYIKFIEFLVNYYSIWFLSSEAIQNLGHIESRGNKDFLVICIVGEEGSEGKRGLQVNTHEYGMLSVSVFKVIVP